MTDQDNNLQDGELERLRAMHARAVKAEPGEATDAAIRAAARERIAARDVRRHWRRWGAAFGVAASIGLAAILAPALFVEAPELLPSQRVRVAYSASEPAATEENAAALPSPPEQEPNAANTDRSQRKDIAITAEERRLMDMGRALAAGSAPRTSDVTVPEPVDVTALEPPPVATPLERVPVTGAQITPDAPVEFAEDLAARERTALREADEETWRARLLALRANGREAVALALLVDFRARFDKPESLTLDDLEREMETGKGTRDE